MLGLTLNGFYIWRNRSSEVKWWSQDPKDVICVSSYRLQRQKTIDSRLTQDRVRECRSTFAHYSPPDCIKSGYKFMRSCDKLVEYINLQNESGVLDHSLLTLSQDFFLPNSGQGCVYKSQGGCTSKNASIWGWLLGAEFWDQVILGRPYTSSVGSSKDVCAFQLA